MVLIFVTLVLSTVIAFAITSYSKIAAVLRLPSTPSLRERAIGVLGSADTYKRAWIIFSSFVVNYVVPTTLLAANVFRDLASDFYHNMQTAANGIPGVIPGGEEAPGESITSRVWTSVSATSASYAQQAAEVLAPLNPAFGPQRLRADIWEDKTNNTIIAEIEVPGIAKADIDISISEGKLIVSTKHETPDRGPVYLMQERAHGESEIKVKLPTGTKGSDLKTSLSNGVLTVSFPRESPNARERIILE
ncbi:hypothetical protein NLI96_g9135 [Meripilus lineatus]|uniref:SHSP domain-containing protein n=1 Tax=Meripilus lineatus TaxID=2056292 RepID=A0AAD5YFJ6_9APHY|nr:hypothetical protein NLI96_g9135 [Physisporinus lineatus]